MIEGTLALLVVVIALVGVTTDVPTLARKAWKALSPGERRKRAREALERMERDLLDDPLDTDIARIDRELSKETR